MKIFTQLLGMALLIAGLLALNMLLFDLARFGTCASGGPYVVARECADGTGAKIGGLFAAVIGGLIGVALARSSRVAMAAWGMLFCGLAITFVMVAFGPAAGENDFGVVAVIVGGIFFLMGLPGLITAIAPGGSGSSGGAGDGRGGRGHGGFDFSGRS